MLDLILLEPDSSLCQRLAERLGREGYRLTQVGSLVEFERAFDPQRHPLALIASQLPDGDGLLRVRRLRQDGLRLGVVVLGTGDDKAGRLAAFASGADHCLAANTDLDELVAALDALAWRLELSRQERAWTLQLGPRQLLPPGGSPVPLSQQDLRVLRCLMEQTGFSVSRPAITQALGEDFLDYDQRRLDTQIRRLRRKVEQGGGLRLPIKTLRNAGYCFYEPIRIQP